MQKHDQSLGCNVPIAEKADQHRRENTANRAGGGAVAHKARGKNMRAALAGIGGDVRAERNAPRAQRPVLQEHHCREPGQERSRGSIWRGRTGRAWVVHSQLNDDGQ